MSHPRQADRHYCPSRYNRNMTFPAIFTALPQHETLRRLVWMRSIAVAVQALGIVVAQFWLGIQLPYVPMLTVILSLAAFNGWTWWRMQQVRPVSDIALFIQLLMDVSALSVLLYFSGGATNPFVSFYLPALAVAAAILPWRFALVLAILSLVCYSMLNSAYVPLRVMDPDRAVNYHLAGMWANFGLSAALITWFVARMSGALRQRSAQLALAREQHLQNERIVALGTQAASAAHEMGTPLSTIAVIAEDLKHAIKSNASLAAYVEELTTIEAQIALCKASLDRMRMHADVEAGTLGSGMALAAWLKQFIAEWRLRCPAIRVDLSYPSSDARIVNLQAVGQILLTLLDNAAQAASATDAAVRIALLIEHRSAILRITDRGPGIPPELLKKLGYEQVQSSAGGQGVGLMLAFATARQIGARIELSSRPNEGTVASLTVPLA